jgi:hypothetical protein
MQAYCVADSVADARPDLDADARSELRPLCRPHVHSHIRPDIRSDLGAHASADLRAHTAADVDVRPMWPHAHEPAPPPNTRAHDRQSIDAGLVPLMWPKQRGRGARHRADVARVPVVDACGPGCALHACVLCR